MRFLTSRVAHVAPIFGLLAIGVISGCHKSKGTGSNGTNPETEQTESYETAAPSKPGKVVVPSGRLAVSKNDGNRIDLPAGQYIVVDLVNGVQYISIEGVIDHASFSNVVTTARSRSTTDAEFQTRLAIPLKDSVAKISATVGGLSNIKVMSKYGFFIAQMKLENYDRLASVEKLPVDIVINPVVVTPLSERNARKVDLPLASGDARTTTDGFSGLARMGVPEFLELVKSDITSVPDGANVNIGVADTGITHNHPSFEDAAKNSRVKYMKDFTGEGRIYFNPSAKFDVVASTENPAELEITAQIIAPVAGAAAKPTADKFVEDTFKVLVSEELKAILTAPNSGAKLGVVLEKQFETAAEKVDINLNGKTDDVMFAIVVNSGDSHKIYLDSTGELDFRKSAALSAFNTSGDTLKLGLEKLGFDIQATTLKNEAGDDVDVLGASIVGYDPGNHGTHVTGIIGGRKTLSNDVDTTLARGAAPNAPLMVNRVCANNGGCISTEAVIDLSENGADVVNMSLGGLSPFNDGYGVAEMIIDRLVETNNTVFVISAGNSGPGINTVGSPSTARHSISVGAAASRSMIERQYQWPATGKPGPTDVASKEKADDDFMLFFSSRGPTAAGGFKPNIAAPGTELSAVQLNTACGARSGLDVYWGTSMSAPAAAGAIALLIDAAKRYNLEHPAAKLPVDALTIRKIIIASAKPFDAKIFDPATGDYTNGQYTWIDQGTGMINLPRAWLALKAERDSALPSAVYAMKDNARDDINLDYQIRVLRQNPNGINYNGSLALPADMMAITGPRFGTGVWLAADSSESLVKVQIARRLPHSATLRSDASDLKRLLVTSKDEFAVKTVIYGSNKNWLSAGTLNQLDCANSPTSQLTIVGEGAVDNFSDPENSSIATNDSTLMVCIDRSILSALPAGDHGALVKLYRKDGEKVESNPALIVPVYVTVPHKTLAGNAGYKVRSTVQSFGVSRNDVNIPEGVNLVTVSLEVPEAVVRGNSVTGCQGVRLYAYEAGNTSLPSEIAGTKSIAVNCDDSGKATPETRIVKYSRSNPTPGIWNLHVFGRYQFPQADFKLKVEYAKVKSSVEKIVGTPEALNGSLEFEVLDASFNAEPAANETTFVLKGLSQSVQSAVAVDEQVAVPDADGVTFRKFGDDVISASISTDGSPGNDIDLYVLECENESMETCSLVGAGTSATDVEEVIFTPAAAKFYLALVLGFEINQGNGSFNLTETRTLQTTEIGTVAVSTLEPGKFKIDHSFDVGASVVLKNELFVGGKYAASGDLTIRTEAGSTMVAIPVEVKAAAAQ